jgi:hypothetical protein
MATKKSVSKKSKTKTSSLSKVQPLEVIAIIIALLFMNYVTTSAQNLFLSTTESNTSNVIDMPYMLLFVFAVLIVALYLEKRKVLSVLSVLIMAILAVSGYFWIFAIRTT